MATGRPGCRMVRQSERLTGHPNPMATRLRCRMEARRLLLNHDSLAFGWTHHTHPRLRLVCPSHCWGTAFPRGDHSGRSGAALGRSFYYFAIAGFHEGKIRESIQNAETG